MKICFVSTEFLTKNKSSSGLPNYLYKVSKALMEKGHIPIIITAGEKSEDTIFDGIKVIRRRTDFFLSSKNEIVSYVCNALSMSFILNQELKKLCKAEKINVIQFCNLNGLGLFYFGKTPAIVRLSSYSKQYYADSTTYSKQCLKIMSKIEVWGSHAAKGIISPSQTVAQAYAKDIGRKITIMETPFVNDVKTPDNTVYKIAFEGKKYILFYGLLDEVKGVIVLSKIVNRVLAENPDYCFAFVGKPATYKGKSVPQLLKNNAGNYKDRLICMNALSHDKLYPIIGGAEFIVLPSLMENLSNACIESMALGKVVIGTDGTSFEQLITDEKSGFLAKPNDTESLYYKITEVIRLDKEKKTWIEKNAKKRIERLLPDFAVSRLLSYYEYIINKSQM